MGAKRFGEGFGPLGLVLDLPGRLVVCCCCSVPESPLYLVSFSFHGVGLCVCVRNKSFWMGHASFCSTEENVNGFGELFISEFIGWELSIYAI